jgi:hypothetical protein
LIPSRGSDTNGARIADNIGFNELAAIQSLLMLYSLI